MNASPPTAIRRSQKRWEKEKQKRGENENQRETEGSSSWLARPIQSSLVDCDGIDTCESCALGERLDASRSTQRTR